MTGGFDHDRCANDSELYLCGITLSNKDIQLLCCLTPAYTMSGSVSLIHTRQMRYDMKKH